MVSAARMAKYRSFRDEASRDFLAALGVKTANDTVTPDIAFSLPAPVGQSPSLAPDAGTQEQVPTVGLGVMAYFGWRHRQQNGQQIYSDYVANLTDFGAWLLERGFRVRLLMGQTEDFPVMEELAGRLREYSHGAFSDRVVAEPVNSLTELMAQMAETEMVVATRFHNVVCSLMAGKPIISIGYAKKNNLLLQAAGLDGFAQHIERLDLDLLKKQFLDLYEHKEKYAPGIKRMTESYRCKLEDQERALLGFISGTKEREEQAHLVMPPRLT
jgi:polysaccharide pyruvyl transferase WcaK-like protein